MILCYYSYLWFSLWLDWDKYSSGHFYDKTLLFSLQLYLRSPKPKQLVALVSKSSKPSRKPLKTFQKSSKDLESMSAGLGMDLNLSWVCFDYIGREQKKITKNHLANFEVSSVKSVCLSEEKEFLKKLFIDLKLRIWPM